MKRNQMLLEKVPVFSPGHNGGSATNLRYNQTNITNKDQWFAINEIGRRLSCSKLCPVSDHRQDNSKACTLYSLQTDNDELNCSSSLKPRQHQLDELQRYHNNRYFKYEKSGKAICLSATILSSKRERSGIATSREQEGANNIIDYPKFIGKTPSNFVERKTLIPCGCMEKCTTFRCYCKSRRRRKTMEQDPQVKSHDFKQKSCGAEYEDKLPVIDSSASIPDGKILTVVRGTRAGLEIETRVLEMVCGPGFFSGNTCSGTKTMTDADWRTRCWVENQWLLQRNPNLRCGRKQHDFPCSGH